MDKFTEIIALQYLMNRYGNLVKEANEFEEWKANTEKHNRYVYRKPIPSKAELKRVRLELQRLMLEIERNYVNY